MLNTEIRTNRNSQNIASYVKQDTHRSLEEFANKANILNTEFSKALREFNEATGDAMIQRHDHLSNVHKRITNFQSDNEASIRSTIQNIKILRNTKVRIITCCVVYSLSNPKDCFALVWSNVACNAQNYQALTENNIDLSLFSHKHNIL